MSTATDATTAFAAAADAMSVAMDRMIANDPHYQQVRLDLSQLDQDQALTCLYDALRRNHVVRRVLLDGCSFGGTHRAGVATPLHNLLEAIMLSKKLRRVRISDVPSSYGCWLRSVVYHNRSIVHLCLSHCVLDAHSTTGMLRAIKYNRTLRAVEFQHVTPVDASVRHALVDMLQFNTTLAALRMHVDDRDGLLTDELFDTLAHRNRTLHCLVLRNSRLSPFALEHLAECLLINNTLVHVDLARCSLRVQSAQLLVQVLRRNTALKVLLFRSPCAGPSAFENDFDADAAHALASFAAACEPSALCLTLPDSVRPPFLSAVSPTSTLETFVRSRGRVGCVSRVRPRAASVRRVTFRECSPDADASRVAVREHEH